MVVSRSNTSLPPPPPLSKWEQKVSDMCVWGKKACGRWSPQPPPPLEFGGLQWPLPPPPRKIFTSHDVAHDHEQIPPPPKPWPSEGTQWPHQRSEAKDPACHCHRSPSLPQGRTETDTGTVG